VYRKEQQNQLRRYLVARHMNQLTFTFDTLARNQPFALLLNHPHYPCFAFHENFATIRLETRQFLLSCKESCVK
jgi:hypothetical protein